MGSLDQRAGLHPALGDCAPSELCGFGGLMELTGRASATEASASRRNADAAASLWLGNSGFGFGADELALPIWDQKLKHLAISFADLQIHTMLVP